MNRKRKWEKEERREAITDVIRQNPCLTDEDLAKRFSVSAATIRLDRQMLGIPQMRKRIEKAVSEHPSGFHEELQILDMEKGKKGLALFHTTEKMTDRSGMVSADRLYAAAILRSLWQDRCSRRCRWGILSIKNLSAVVNSLFSRGKSL